MRRTIVFILGFLSPWLLLSEIAISSSCTSSPCIVLVLDAPFFETVYDRERFLAGQTNADAICDILRHTVGSEVVLRSRRTDPQWFNDHAKFKEATDSNPDLIVLHTSAFFSPWSEEQTIQFLSRLRGQSLLKRHCLVSTKIQKQFTPHLIASPDCAALS